MHMNKELISQRDCSTTILQVLFFLSGASSLIFETIFTRLLTYTFGNTAYAVSTVLASFLGGLAVGAFVLGGWLDRRAPSLRFYGGLELLIGVYCLFIPSLFGWLTESYVALYYRLQLGTAGLTTLRVGLSSILILVPSFLMGGTLPAIARFLAARRSDFQSELDRFYALNTLGAASGVLISTYALIPVLGIRGTIVIASSINILIAIASNIRALSQGVVFSKSEEQESRTRDLLVILNTAAQVFPHIAFFQGANPGHGLLIASSSPLQPDYARIAAFDEDAKINQDLQLMGLPSMWSLLGELVLYDHSYQQAISSLPAMTGLPRDFSSTDLRPYLEYQVPKGITLSYDTVKPNSEFLQRFRIASFPPELAITNLPSENERNLIFGYIAERRGDFTQALSRFKTVEGPDANRAQREMLRVHDTLPNSVPGTD